MSVKDNIDKTKLPNHVAIIPDGNRRWAREHNLSTFFGHKKGFNALIKIGRRARKLGIKVLTVWAFSTENWDRSKEEVSYLMDLYQTMIDRYLKDALKEKIRIVHLGRKDKINTLLRNKIIAAEQKTKSFNKYYLCIALDYGGREEIVRSINKLNNKKDITEEIFEKYLDTSILPYSNPELIIRTGGEQRLSGFMLWQSEYSELMFVKKYLPDFSPDDFQDCITNFSKRQRRFGK